MFTLCCIQAKAYNYALPLLDQTAFNIDPEATAIESRDVRLYFYYGGVVYMAMKRFSQAIEFLKAVRFH